MVSRGSFIIFNIFILALVILLARDPFSGQNAISELEPSPDAIHYLSPVKSLFDGHGFAITYQGRSIPTSVPPLYSLTLIPFYGLFHDPRMFYLLNTSLAILSACLFYKLCQKLFHSPLVLWLTFASFATNFILFWYPSYPMAENLLIFLSVISFFLLVPPLSWKKALGAGLVAALMFATKYVAWVQGLSLLLVYLWIQLSKPRISVSGLESQKKAIQSLILIIAAAAGLSLSILFEYLTKGPEILSKISSTSNHFANAPFRDNFVRYLFGLVGGSVTVAGQGFVLVSPVIGFGAIIAVFLLAWNSLTRYIFVYILIGILGSLFYLSAFETVDARYFFAFIPGLTLLFGFSLGAISSLLEKFHLPLVKKLFLGSVIVLVICFSSPTVYQTFKTNLTHSDRSVNFETISVINRYFATRDFLFKPTVIVVLSPYQVDFFSNHSYELLPLSKKQYFTTSETQTWAVPSNRNYFEDYREHLAKGEPLFVSNYHTTPDFVFWKDFQALGQNFRLTKVADGCEGLCNLYQIDSL